MRGVNPVPDYLDKVAGILADDRNFTDREPVYTLDPEGSLFWVDRPAAILPIGAVVPKPPEGQISPNWPGRYARYRLDRAVALRINDVIGDFNAFGDLALETIRQLAEAHRHLEDELRRLAQKNSREQRELLDEIAVLRSEVSALRRAADGETE